MVDLDKRLRNLDFESPTGRRIAMNLTPVEIETIKQAFIDAGWLDNRDAKKLVDFKKHVKGCMTGKDWYKRFEKELRGKAFPHHCAQDQANVLNVLTECQEAAKKASGIES